MRIHWKCWLKWSCDLSQSLIKWRVSQLLLPPSNFKKSWGHGYQLVSSPPLPLYSPTCTFWILNFRKKKKILKLKFVLPYWPHHLWIACHVLVRSIGLVQCGYSISQIKASDLDLILLSFALPVSWVDSHWVDQLSHSSTHLQPRWFGLMGFDSYWQRDGGDHQQPWYI